MLRGKESLPAHQILRMRKKRKEKEALKIHITVSEYFIRKQEKEII